MPKNLPKSTFWSYVASGVNFPSHLWQFAFFYVKAKKGTDQVSLKLRENGQSKMLHRVKLPKGMRE